jgi:hypothetical protein
MIELEIQGLSEKREGLLIEVGGFVIASGFILQRQRLTQGAHGILLTMVVRGPARKKRSLEATLEGYDRFISFDIAPFVEGSPRPHFAESRKIVPHAVAPVPPPAVQSALPVAPVAAAAVEQPEVAESVAAHAVPDEPAAQQEPEFDFIPATPRAPAPPPVVTVPFVELVALGPDEPAVDRMLRELADAYPRIVPHLLVLDRAVAEGAREASLALAGQRTGSWVFRSEYLLDDGLDLREATERIGVPALRALVEVDQQGSQLHIHDSPLCAQDGHSGCSFYGGFLEGLLGPAIAPGSLSIFPVCCRSYGADECVLAISD